MDTPKNKAIVQRLWKERPEEGHLTGITTFGNSISASPEDLLIAELDSIDLHHGSYSADPPYTIIEVVGTALTERVSKELSAYGFNEFHTNSSGFTANRAL